MNKKNDGTGILAANAHFSHANAALYLGEVQTAGSPETSTTIVQEFDVQVVPRHRESIVQELDIEVVPPGTFWRNPRESITTDFTVSVTGLGTTMPSRESVVVEFSVVSGGTIRDSVVQEFDIEVVREGSFWRYPRESIVHEFEVDVPDIFGVLSRSRQSVIREFNVISTGDFPFDIFVGHHGITRQIQRMFYGVDGAVVKATDAFAGTDDNIAVRVSGGSLTSD